MTPPTRGELVGVRGWRCFLSRFRHGCLWDSPPASLPRGRSPVARPPWLWTMRWLGKRWNLRMV